MELGGVALFVYADTKKMPLGKLSKVQIAKGFEVNDFQPPNNGPNKGQVVILNFFRTVPLKNFSGISTCPLFLRLHCTFKSEMCEVTMLPYQ